MSRVGRLRDWLDRNEVFFETVAFVLLSLMALFVSIKANDIASYQAEIMKAEHLPFIHVSLAFIPESDDNQQISERLVISNIGSHLRKFQGAFAIFYRYKDESREVLYPLIDYYFVYWTGNSKGEVAILTNSDVSTWLKNRHRHGSVNSTQKFDIVRYVRVDYEDILGESHEEFYYVDFVEGTQPLSKSEGEEIFREQVEMIRDGLYIKRGSWNETGGLWSLIMADGEET